MTEPPPPALGQAFDAWDLAGRPAQSPIRWNRELWAQSFPDHDRLLCPLPDQLGRTDLVARAARIRNSTTALDAFLVCMVWGFGFTGYGAFRVRRMIDVNGGPEAFGDELLDIADECREEGGLAAFRSISRRRARHRHYLSYLGPAFGTKYLYACTAATATPENPATPILDAMVQRWFRRCTGIELVVDRWHPDSYRVYLDRLDEWAAQLAIAHDDVEAILFADQAAATGSPWTQSWLPRSVSG